MIWLLTLLGIFLLYLGAEFLVRFAVQFSYHFKVPKLVIGLTIVAFAIAVPDAIINVSNQIKGANGDIALKNVIGSNIANVGLILGISLLVLPCRVTHEMKWYKMPILFVVYFLLFLVMVGGKISRIEGIYLFLVLGFYNIFLYCFPPKTKLKDKNVEKKLPAKIFLQIFALICGVILLVAGNQILLKNAMQIATHFQVSKQIIAPLLNISFPALAIALIATFRKQQEILIGAIIGSNIFLPLLTISLAAILHPIYFSQKMLIVDFSLMVAFAIFLWILMILGKRRLSRISGSILLASYVSYIAFLFFS